MAAVLRYQVYLGHQSTHRKRYFCFASFIGFDKKSRVVAPSRNFIMSRNCTSANLNKMKSFAFLITDVSCSLSRMKKGIN